MNEVSIVNIIEVSIVIVQVSHLHFLREDREPGGQVPRQAGVTLEKTRDES